jgi:hypothetical protein
LDEVERAGRLMRDLLHQLFDSLLEMSLADAQLTDNKVFMKRLGDLLDAIGTVSIVGDVEVEDSSASRRRSESTNGSFG